jgi:hypothetical protein
MANYKGATPFNIPRPIAMPDGWNAETLSGDKTLTLKDSMMQALDCGGSSRNLHMPSGHTKGRYYYIANKSDAAEIFVVFQPDGSTEVCRIDQNDCAIIYAADSVAAGASSGWSLFFMFSGNIA